MWRAGRQINRATRALKQGVRRFFFNKTGFLHTRHQTLGPFFSSFLHGAQFVHLFLRVIHGTPCQINLLRRTSPWNRLRLMQQMVRQRRH